METIEQTPTQNSLELKEIIKENIHISKNSKGITWDFRMLGLDVDATRKKIIEINGMINSLGIRKR